MNLIYSQAEGGLYTCKMNGEQQQRNSHRIVYELRNAKTICERLGRFWIKLYRNNLVIPVGGSQSHSSRSNPPFLWETPNQSLNLAV